MDMKSITNKNCAVTLDEDNKVIIRYKSTSKTLIRQRCINELYPVSIEDLLLVDEPSAAVAVGELSGDHKKML